MGKFIAFLSQFAGRANRPHTIIVMDAEQMEPPRQYQVRPQAVLLWGSGLTAGLTVLILALVMLTPLREMVPGYGTAEMRRAARLNALRLASLQDSLAVQQQYMRQLRHLVTGEVDSALFEGTAQLEPAVSPETEDIGRLTAPYSPDWGDHAQPALPMVRLAVESESAARSMEAVDLYVSSLNMPVLPPLSGFVTRGFDARTGHFAVDIAVKEGTVVHAIGDGYVIFADWTQEGGDAIAVQHADGFVSVFKHNQRLLKRVGDRVRDREAIAISGNSGEVTTGPHLHFELWHNGLAQDPRSFVVGW